MRTGTSIDFTKRAVVFSAVISLLCVTNNLTAEPSPDAGALEINAVTFTTALIPVLSSSAVEGFLNDPDSPNPAVTITADSLHLTSLTPLFVQGNDQRWGSFGVQGSMFLLSSASRLAFGNEFLTTYLFNQALFDMSFVNSYTVYRGYRDGSNDPVYPKNDRTHSWAELIVTPFTNVEVYKNPLVWAVPVGVTGLLIGYNLLFADSSNAVWETGEAYVEDQAAPIWAAGLGTAAYWGAVSLIVGTSEEMLFRGYLYDELSHRANPWVAKAVDIVLFSLVHIPFDISNGRSWQETAFLTAIRLTGTLGLDFAYDIGGLPHTVTLHAMTDFLGNLFLWLYKGGAPRSAVGYRIPF
jgi:membrane protease YdiL (CAAX protease family)